MLPNYGQKEVLYGKNNRRIFDMFIHLVEDPSDDRQYQTMIETKFSCHLISFAYRGTKIDSFVKGIAYNHELSLRMLIDSGAFTAYTLGKTITVEEYSRWALEFNRRWRNKVKSLYFFNLDVIGSQEKSNYNLHRLEAMGLRPIPIFTFKADISHLIYYLENYEYIGFGGLVGKGSMLVIRWLDYCYKQVNKYYLETGILRKTHLLGISKQEILERYPVYSCDSSGWMACLRFGGGRAIGKAKIPKPSESPEALKITLITLRAEVAKYQKLQSDVTKLWAKRGIKWED